MRNKFFKLKATTSYFSLLKNGLKKDPNLISDSKKLIKE